MNSDALYNKIYPIQPKQAYRTYNSDTRVHDVTYRAYDMLVICTVDWYKTYKVEVFKKNPYTAMDRRIGTVYGDKAKAIYDRALRTCGR